jgi:hypothetical protein
MEGVSEEIVRVRPVNLRIARPQRILNPIENEAEEEKDDDDEEEEEEEDKDVEEDDDERLDLRERFELTSKAAKGDANAAAKLAAHKARSEADNTVMSLIDVACIAVPTPKPPQPVDSAVATQIAQAIREWEYESPDVNTELYPDQRKPQKLFAILNHNYTTEALKKGFHALKGRDRVLGNLLDSARQIRAANHDGGDDGGGGGGGDGGGGKTLKRKAGSGGGGSSSSKQPKQEKQEDDEPYAFDVFVTLMMGIEMNGEGTDSMTTHTTDPLIPLLPGDPRVFKTLAQKKGADKPGQVCWHPSMHDGLEMVSKLESILYDGPSVRVPVPEAIKASLARAGLFVPKRETKQMFGRSNPGYYTPKKTPAQQAKWRKWEVENDVESSVDSELREFKGDLFIELNELLLFHREAGRGRGLGRGLRRARGRPGAGSEQAREAGVSRQRPAVHGSLLQPRRACVLASLAPPRRSREEQRRTQIHDDVIDATSTLLDSDARLV